ncbi:MAG: twin-arginine translocation signal domain-containing protein [Halioglobus sp.]
MTADSFARQPVYWTGWQQRIAMMNRRQFLKASTAVAATAPLVAACGSEHGLRIDRSLPVSSFGASSTAEDVTRGLDLRGKTALVTGCNSGIGYDRMRVSGVPQGRPCDRYGQDTGESRGGLRECGGTKPRWRWSLPDFQSSIDLCGRREGAMGTDLDMPDTERVSVRSAISN